MLQPHINDSPQIYIIAGEPSGDFIGARLIESIKNLRNDIRFVGVGGPQMIKAGINSLFPISEISLMGFLEILPKILKLRRLILNTVQDIIYHRPDVLVTIDSPGFTYRVAERVRKLLPSLKIIHIVAPSVWAYKPNRVFKYAKVYNHLLALLPFEPKYFTKVGLNCTYIGHPIAEQSFYQDKQQLREEFKINKAKKIIAVTVGSRIGEILRHAPIFIESLNIIAKHIPEMLVIFVLADTTHETLIKKFLSNADFSFIFSYDKLKIFALADAALAKSGTNTLEISASNTPLVIAYKLNPITFWIIKFMIKVKYASIINIVANEEIVPEFIQANCTPDKITACLHKFLTDSKTVSNQLQKSRHVLNTLGFNNNDKKPSVIAAETILSLI